MLYRFRENGITGLERAGHLVLYPFCENGITATTRMKCQIELIYATMIAELVDKTLDAQFDADFASDGLFKKRTVKGRDYWYFRPSTASTPGAKEKYAGPADDPAIASRVENFSHIKADQKYRQRLVSTLVREARLMRPDARVSAILDRLAKAGIFRLRACLVGTVAYQTYSTLLGYRLPDAAMHDFVNSQ